MSQELAIDSSLHYFDISISPLFNDKRSKSRGAVAIFHDITEHKKTEKVRMDFVANASHELKTPVTSVKGYLDIIKMKADPEDSDLKMAFEVIDKNIFRLNRLVSDLLDLSKIESSDEIEKEVIHVQELTENILGELNSQWKSKDHDIETIFEIESLPANRDYIEQTLINLIENAIKYCPEKSKIRIRWCNSESGYCLSVKDNGPGIESYHQGRLFERFYRVRDEESQQTQGTGLGLSIVRHAMQKQGGYVDLKSTPGLGTDFVCMFPR
ncbi:MAG: ATP-binding protein [Bdellovibrionales bacterium]|nr:ATP-binding protein [Bdellovibrionales bacterium]